MSVQTKNDEKLDLVKTKIDESYKLLLEILGNDPEYIFTYVATLHEVVVDLYKVAKKIK